MLLVSVRQGKLFFFSKTSDTLVFFLSCPPTALLCALFQGGTVIRRFSGSENTIPSSGKDELPNRTVNAASKQGFAIYVDEPEQKENYGCQVAEELESSLCELDTSAMTSSIHLLLDLSTGNSCYYSGSIYSTSAYRVVMNCDAGKLLSSLCYSK